MYDEHISSYSSATFFGLPVVATVVLNVAPKKKERLMFSMQLPLLIIKLLFKYHNKPTKDFITT